MHPILELIQQGENSAIEFKSADVKPDALATELIAFANMQGGTVLIGVNDRAELIGVPNTVGYEEWVMNIACNNIYPPLQVQFEWHTIESVKIAAINVPKGKNKPYQTLSGKYYIRVGSTNRIASVEELMRLFQESGVFHYDAVGVDKTTENNLNLAKVDAYFKRYEINFNDEPAQIKIQLLKNSDILTDEGTLTLGGLLTFGINPERYLFQSGIIFAHFAGNQMDAELIDRQEINGTLDYLINTASAVIKNNIAMPSGIIGNLRIDKKVAYPDQVFRELITNACLHRNYAIHGSKIRIFMFDDRIEIMSPGRVPNSVSLEKILAGVSYARNPIVAKFMANLRFTDIMGRGIPYVVNQAKLLNKKLRFEEIGEEFKVVLEL